MYEIAGRLILNWNSKLRKNSPVAKYLNVNANLCCTEIGILITVGFLTTLGAIISASQRNVAMSILIKLRYDAMSSADGSRTIVANAPLSPLLRSQDLSGPFFRFSCSSSSHRVTTTASTLTLHVTSTAAILQQKCCQPVATSFIPSTQGQDQFECAHAPTMFPRFARSVSDAFFHVSTSFATQETITETCFWKHVSSFCQALIVKQMNHALY